MNNSPFFKLPREVRDSIWDFALHSTKPILVKVSKRRTGLDFYGSPSSSLFRTCEQAGAEASERIIPNNHFVIKQRYAAEVARIQELLYARGGELIPRSLRIEIYCKPRAVLFTDVRNLRDDLIPSIRRIRDRSTRAPSCHVIVTWYFHWHQYDNRRFSLDIDLETFDRDWERVEWEVQLFSRARWSHTKHRAALDCWDEVRRIADAQRWRRGQR